MKKSPKFSTQITTLLILICVFIACSGDDDSSATNETNPDTEASDYDITPILTKFSAAGLSYEISGGNVIFTTNDLPDHKSPYYLDTEWESSLYEAYNGSNTSFNLNPNRIAAQNITITIPLHPAEASNKEATALGTMGLAVNGVVFYNQYAGPNNQPLTSEINSFDQYLGHPQQQGGYHYHQEPVYLTNKFGNDTFLGLLADGFPVYGPIENGDEITNADLDDYHGHVGVTADFPNGIYHYHITSEDPYINGNGFFGTPGNITN
ncbi:YHYH protein [Aquimarina sp. 2201CG1-2-11]|uniref:YHYH protein n=1 Tax=Aquimarina discodermiae TaxID=3231043 RepID=UPI0034619BAF